jgi:very-short-patch-repair endonuclease
VAPGSRITDHSSGPRRVDRAVAARAAEQHGVVALGQLRALGLTDHQVYSRVERGWLHRSSPGVFAVGHPRLTPDGRRMAAVFSCGEGALLSHLSAARAWGLLEGGDSRIDVLVRHESGGIEGASGVRRRHTRRLLAEDRAMLRGIPITSVPRTLLDVAGEQRGRLVRRAVHEAEVRDMLDVAAVLRAIECHPGRRGTRALRTALGISAPDPTNSQFAAAFARLCARHGLPAPKLGVHRDIGGRLAECDAVFDAERVIVELDSERIHRTRLKFHTDRERDAQAAAQGWLVVRLTWHRVTRDAPAVAAQIRQILAVRTAVAPDRRR